MKHSIQILDGDIYNIYEQRGICLVEGWENQTGTYQYRPNYPEEEGGETVFFLDGEKVMLEVEEDEVYLPHDCNDWVDNAEADKGMI